MFKHLKNDATNSPVQTEEVYQAMPNVTAICNMIKKLGLRSRVFNSIHKFKECGYFIQNKNKIIICKSYEGYVYQIDLSDEITIDDYLREVKVFVPKIKLNKF